MKAHASRPGDNYADPTSPHVVYEIWGDDVCLYVGCSFYPLERIRVHGKKPWFVHTTRVVWDYYPDAESALTEEKRRIQALKPTHNRVHNMTPEERRSGWDTRRSNRLARHNRGEMCPHGGHVCRECNLIREAMRHSKAAS